MCSLESCPLVASNLSAVFIHTMLWAPTVCQNHAGRQEYHLADYIWAYVLAGKMDIRQIITVKHGE